MTEQVERLPEGIRCLFTQKDWEDWEEIDARTKGRGPKFKAGSMSFTYPKVFCEPCARIISIVHLRHHIQCYHKFWRWIDQRAFEEECEENYKMLKEVFPNDLV